MQEQENTPFFTQNFYNEHDEKTIKINYALYRYGQLDWTLDCAFIYSIFYPHKKIKFPVQLKSDQFKIYKISTASQNK